MKGHRARVVSLQSLAGRLAASTRLGHLKRKKWEQELVPAPRKQQEAHEQESCPGPDLCLPRRLTYRKPSLSCRLSRAGKTTDPPYCW